MTPLTRTELTEKERKRIREELFEEKRKDTVFVKDAIGNMSNFIGRMWDKAWMERDWFRLGELTEQAVKEYIEDSRLVEEAESDLMASKEINGKRYYEA